MALLQVQIKDFNGHANTRYKLLKEKQKAINNWVAYALALYLKGDY